MTGLNKDDASRARPRGLRSSLTGTRWGLWLCSLSVAAGAVLLVTLTSTGGGTSQVPSALQVGRQAAAVTSRVPASSVPATSPGPGASSPATTTTAVTHRTTVINPLSTVTDQEDSSGDGNSSGTNAGPATRATTANPSTNVDH